MPIGNTDRMFISDKICFTLISNGKGAILDYLVLYLETPYP